MRKSTLKTIVYITGILVLLCFSSMVLFSSALNKYENDLIAKAAKFAEASRTKIVEKLNINGKTNTDGDTYTFDNKKYKVFCQFANDYEGYNKYLRSHGCAACSLTTILAAYREECSNWTPYETITIAEKTVGGESTMKSNYSKSHDRQMPITLYGISRVLNHYRIDNEYVTNVGNMGETKKDIAQNLEKGDPVLFVVSQVNRATGKKSSKWTGSYHTMVMIGMEDEENVLIANPAGKKRLNIVSLEEMINYMWSCTDEPDGFYWNGKKRCGGYIKVLL